jgi:ligand-binding sensor domain-containing protein
MKIRNFFLIVSLLGLLAQPPRTAQESTETISPATTATQEEWRTYSKITTVHALAIQSNYLWAGTDGGVVRWNTQDHSFKRYVSADSLANYEITAITLDTVGNVWIGSYGGGVSKFDGANWTRYTQVDGLASNGVLSIGKDPAGSLWFGTDSGVSKFDGATWTTYTTVDGLAGDWVTAVSSDLTGNLWFAVSIECFGGGCQVVGLSKFDGATWTTYTIANGLASNWVQAITSDAAGNVWFGTDSGVSKFDGTKWTTYTSNDGLASNLISSIASDASGSIWFGTWDSGVSEFDGETWTTYTTADGLASNYVDAIANDQVGNVWFSTGLDKSTPPGTIGGVSKFGDSHFTTYTLPEGLVDNWITAIASDASGNTWFGTFEGAVSKFDGTTWTTYTSANGLPSINSSTIASDPAGNVWFGTDGGVIKYNGDSWTTFTLAANSITAIASDPKGNIWVGIELGCGRYYCDYGGVSKFEGATWTNYTTADGLADNHVTAIASDKSGNIWVGTNAGVSEFDGTAWTSFFGEIVTAIASDPAGNVWFGTDGSGVSKFDGLSWTTYTTANGLASNNISSIASDLVGNIWVGTDNYGVSKYNGSSWSIFTTYNGLADNWVTAITRDADGNLWFGTLGGASELYFIRSLDANYAGGAPGSYFNLSSDHFPANQSVPVWVNDAQLGDVPVSSNGIFTFTLSTASASQGLYIVNVGERPSVQARLSVDAQQPVQPKEGDFTTFDIPAGIAFTKEYYLPVLRR